MRVLRSTLALLTFLSPFAVPVAIATDVPFAAAAPSTLRELQAPVDIVVAPGTVARQTVFASDWDGDPLQFTKLFGPDFMSVGSHTHMGAITKAPMTFAPGATDIGVYDAAVEVTDGAGGSAQGLFTIRTIIPVRPASGLVDFETPHFDQQRRTLDPYIDPNTGIVFHGRSSGVEVGLVNGTGISACVPSELSDQKLGTAALGDDSAGLTSFSARADFGLPLIPPCTVSVEFQTTAGVSLRLRLFDETGAVVGSASGTAGPGLAPCFPSQGAVALTRLTATTQQSVAYAVMEETSGISVIAFDDFQYSSTPPPVTATLNLDPDVINLASRAPWVTAYIGLSEGSPANIDVTTLRLAGSIAPDPKLAKVGDLTGDGALELMVKFSRQALDPLLTLGENDLTITGSLLTGESISATDQIRVIDPAGSHLSVSAHPNPLRRSGTLTFATTRAGRAHVAIFDVHGSLVRILMDTPSLAAGSHTVPFDGLGQSGISLPSGVYFYKVSAAEGSSRGRIVLSR